MIEKLLENWLDSASERSYQAVFVQMLVAEGYTVLHSTRHCLLEFGKDVLAVAPDGVGCAFQLKGDPKGRMTISHFRRDIQPQLWQLSTQSPSYPGFPKGPHRSYLVTNGQFEEEVQVAVQQMSGQAGLAIQLWSRGHLLDLCIKHGSALWPSELVDNRALLELYLADPKDQLPIDVLSKMLVSILNLSSDGCLSESELKRAVTSATWVTGISTATFAESENYQALAYGWTLCCVSLLSAAIRHGNADYSLIISSLELARKTLLDALAALWEEVRTRKYLTEGEVLSDPEVYGWRVGVLFGLLASLALADQEHSVLDSKSREELDSWLKSTKHTPLVWGEGAIANLIPRLVLLRRIDATIRPDLEIKSLTDIVVSANSRGSNSALANPYYKYDEVFRSRTQFSKRANVFEDGETFEGSSYTSELLLHLLVRTNLKQACKTIWPRFSRLTHRYFKVDSAWQYCLLEAGGGVDETFVRPATVKWEDLRSEALDQSSGVIPDMLIASAWLLSMWWQVAPHRLNRDSVRLFAERVNPGWGS